VDTKANNPARVLIHHHHHPMTLQDNRFTSE
jgi:hypothetical protein